MIMIHTKNTMNVVQQRITNKGKNNYNYDRHSI